MPEDDDNPDYDAALEEVLKSLRSDYLNELPERIAEMKDYLQKAKDDEEKQREWLADAHTVAHRLAGTAGSYGFAELSHAAAEVDQYMKKLLKSNAQTGEVANRLNWQLMDELVDEMDKAVPSK